MAEHPHVSVCRQPDGDWRVHYIGLTQSHTARTAQHTDCPHEAEAMAVQMERDRQLEVFNADITDRSVWPDRYARVVSRFR